MKFIQEHILDIISEQTFEKVVILESVSHYLDNFKYGCVPDLVFGLGIELVIAKLLGLSSVKESSFSPINPNILSP